MRFSFVATKITDSCNEKRSWNSFTPTMLLAPTFRVTRLTPTPLNSMSVLRSQNKMTLQLAPTPLNSMSALRSQNNTPCIANLVFL